VAKGKPEASIISVCNRPLKQAFAILESGLRDEKHYKRTVVKN
jgi:hypothetical protein